MNPIWRFRIAAFSAVLAIGSVAIMNLTAELVRAPPSSFPGKGVKALPQTQVDTANWVAGIAPFRTDLKSDFALKIAIQALTVETRYKPELNQEAQAAAKRALLAGPHDSRIWLVLALLQNQRDLHDPQVAELLKMSYFTGPNLMEVVPSRLETVFTNAAALDDRDLRGLVRGDFRLILTRHPDLKTTITDAYRGGSIASKHFIEESTNIVDPQFSGSLLSGKP